MILKNVEQLHEEGQKSPSSVSGKLYTFMNMITSFTVVGWVVIIGGFLLWGIYTEKKQMQSLVMNTARANFDKDQAFRIWGASHGGVYVPSTLKTPPNPYLSHIPERDIVTPSGKNLTLMNPAYMLRQMMERYGELYGIKGRITSLTPLNPENGPDQWERMALKKFEGGLEEFFEFTEIEGKPFLRLMRPMVTMENCLKCHAHQGYKVGDIRGGVGVSVPVTPYMELGRNLRREMIVSYSLIGLFGLFCIGIIAGVIKKRIKEQLAAEELLGESEIKFRTIADFTYDWEYWLSPDGTIRYMSPSCKRITGYQVEEFLQDSTLLQKIILPSDLHKWKAHESAIQSNMDHSAVQFRIKQRDGAIIWMEHVCCTVEDEYGNFLGFRASNRDITDRKIAEKKLQLAYDELEIKVAERTRELQKANSKLTELDHMKSLFIASMSHELRTPLNSIMGFTGVILNGMSGTINARQEDQLKRVYRSSKHLLSMINDIIDISKIESGNTNVIVHDFYLHTLIADAIADVQEGLKKKGLLLEVDVPENLQMHTDDKRLFQCILNLLSNGIKFTERGTVIIKAEIKNSKVIISVSDTGIGIASEDIARLFHPFERIQSKLSVKAGGTGLGLYLTRKLVKEVLHGEIEVKSEKDKGSVFTLSIPNSL